MTKLKFFKDGTHYLGFECEGHSGYAEEGSDVVCASISAAIQLTAAYLTEYFREYVTYTADEENAKIVLVCLQSFLEADRQISVLVAFAECIQKQYTDYFTYEIIGGVNND